MKPNFDVEAELAKILEEEIEKELLLQTGMTKQERYDADVNFIVDFLKNKGTP